MDVFLGDISFFIVLELVSSFSSRSYPSVRKCTDHCGMNMTTYMVLKARTRCYPFDQSVRKCNYRIVHKKMALYFRTEWYLLCYFCCVKHPAHRNSKRGVYTLCGAGTRNQRREATLLLVVVLQSGAAVAVVWAHSRIENCASDLLVEGIHAKSKDAPSRLRSKQALTSTVSQ